MRLQLYQTALAAFMVVGTFGCTPKGYQYGRFRKPGSVAPTYDIVFGEPHPTLDKMAKCIDAPARVFGVEKPSRELSPETAELLSEYLQKNELDELRIEIGVYDPAGQWRRLHHNNRISPVWRYTAGALSVVGYTLFPGRVWGINKYNPYTDSLQIHSNKPMDLLQESAVAKSIRSQRWPGPYAVFTSLPLIALVRHGQATDDVVNYARAENEWEIEKRAYRELYPQAISRGMGGVGPIVSVAVGVAWWVRPMIGLGGSVLGRTLGYVIEKQRERERSETQQSQNITPPS